MASNLALFYIINALSFPAVNDPLIIKITGCVTLPFNTMVLKVVVVVV